ncbi:MAG: hypothetical protein LUC44_02850 [Prevotellaceae bacterium]|nr:hypothetical protein [Prevotellaceae bacterium]
MRLITVLAVSAIVALCASGCIVVEKSTQSAAIETSGAPAEMPSLG